MTAICSDAAHPVYPYLREWAAQHRAAHTVDVVHKRVDARGGDILFLISCHELIPAAVRALYRKTLVIHAGDLPLDRGWSPHVWSIIEGADTIVVTLLEAADAVDAGDIWRKVQLSIERHEVYDEINARLFKAEIELMDFAVANIDCVVPQPQNHATATYRPRRTAADSRLDLDATLRDQFNLLRIADPHRFPCFIEHEGHIYDVIVRKRRV